MVVVRRLLSCYRFRGVTCGRAPGAVGERPIHLWEIALTP